ncbi:MAG: AraC family transcriptional regulator [Planctomycetota bacterium]
MTSPAPESRAGADPPRGLLHRDAAGERFDLTLTPPSPGLAEYVEVYWDVQWDRSGHPPHDQEILPHPSIQLVIEAGHSGVFGIGTGKSVKMLEGKGRAFGIKFRPGMFASLHQPVASLTDRQVPLEELFGERGAEYERSVLEITSGSDRIALAEAFLHSLAPPIDPDMLLARRLVERATHDRDCQRVEDLAAESGLSVRSLQRLFARVVGVSPKWVIQRYRLHEAVQCLEQGDPVDLLQLAQRLGYFDQSHFNRDFKKIIGATPARYAAQAARPTLRKDSPE